MAIITNKKNSTTISGTSQNDYIEDNGYNNTIKTSSGDDTIVANGNSAKIYAGSGSNLIKVWYESNKNATVNYEGGVDTINLNCKDVASLDVSRDNYNLIIKDNEADKTLTLVNYFNPSKTKDTTFINSEGSPIDLTTQIGALTFKDDLTNKYFKTLKETNMADTVNLSGTRNKLYTYAGNDSINVYDKNNTIYSGEGDDTISLSAANKVYAGNGNDSIIGSDGNDTVYGEDGADTISTGIGNDVIYTGNGNGQNTEVNAGEGNDKIYVGSGKNLIVQQTTANAYFGNDTLYLSGGDDTIEFKCSKAELTYTKNNNDLVVTTNYGTTTISNFFKSESNAYHKSIKTTDDEFIIKDELNTNNNIKTLEFVILESPNKGKKITGTYLNDIIVDGGYKNDTIYGGAGNDTIQVAGGNNVIYTGSGNDDIRSGYGRDKIYAQSGSNGTYQFDEYGGKDTIYSSTNSGTITFNKDILSGVDYSKNGNDLILKYKDSIGDYTNTITLKDYAKGNFKGWEIADTDKSISSLISDKFIGYHDDTEEDKFASTEDIGKLNTKKHGYLVTGTMLNDKIKSTGTTNDTIKAGGGDDIIKAWGSNTVVYAGYGDDKIYVDEAKTTIYCEQGNNHIEFQSAGTSTVYLGNGKAELCFDNATSEDALTYTQSSNKKDLIITACAGTSNEAIVTVKDYFKNPSAITSVKYSTDEGVNYTEISTKTITQLTNNVISGNDYKKNKLTGTSLNDVINGGSYNDTIKAGSGNDTINGGDGKDLIYGEAGNDSIDGGSGNDTIYAGSGNDIIVGGTGNDKFYGQSGNNTYDLTGGGKDTLYAGKNNETLVIGGGDFSGTTRSDVTYTSNGKDLTIKYGNSGDSVTLANFVKNATKNKGTVKEHIFVTGSSDKVGTEISATNLTITYDKSTATKKVNLKGTILNDEMTGSDFNDTIKAGSGSDIISGGDGKDKLYGEAGNDTIYGGWGNDSIYGGSGNDVLYADNTFAESAEVGATKLVDGGSGNDIIYGSYQNTYRAYNKHGDLLCGDSLYGGNGNDTICAVGETSYVDGGKGDDIIYLNYADGEYVKEAELDHFEKFTTNVVDKSGNDHYYTSANGTSEIDDKSGDDILTISDFSFDTNSVIFDVTIDKNGNIVQSSSKDLLLTNNDVLNSINNGNMELDQLIDVKNYFGNGQIETINDEYGHTLTLANVQKIQSEVAGWLKENSYTSSMQVMSKGSDFDITALLKTYTDTLHEQYPTTP